MQKHLGLLWGPPLSLSLPLPLPSCPPVHSPLEWTPPGSDNSLHLLPLHTVMSEMFHSPEKSAGAQMWSMTFLTCHPAVTRIAYDIVGFFCSFRNHIWFYCHSWHEQDTDVLKLRTVSQLSCLNLDFLKCTTLLSLYFTSVHATCMAYLSVLEEGSILMLLSFLGEFFLTQTESLMTEGVVCCTDGEALWDSLAIYVLGRDGKQLITFKYIYFLLLYRSTPQHLRGKYCTLYSTEFY